MHSLARHCVWFWIYQTKIKTVQRFSFTKKVWEISSGVFKMFNSTMKKQTLKESSKFKSSYLRLPNWNELCLFRLSLPITPTDKHICPLSKPFLDGRLDNIVIFVIFIIYYISTERKLKMRGKQGELNRPKVLPQFSMTFWGGGGNKGAGLRPTNPSPCFDVHVLICCLRMQQILVCS